MNKQINAIKNYLKYYPNSSEAKNNLMLCEYAEELGIELNGSYYPKIDYGRFMINDLIYATKKVCLTNHTKDFVPNEIDTLIVWHSTCGRLRFVNQEYWFCIQEEWEWFFDKLKEYKPLDYDETSNIFVFSIENGKKLIEDYTKIIDEFKTKLKQKIIIFEKEKKMEELKKLQAELENDIM